MRRLFASMVIAGALALAIPIGGCSTVTAVYDSFTSTSPTQENAAAAAENLYTATVSLGTAYVKTGKATPEQLDRMEAVEKGAYAALLKVRAAVKAGDSVALAAAKAALDAYNSQMRSATGASP